MTRTAFAMEPEKRLAAWRDLLTQAQRAGDPEVTLGRIEWPAFVGQVLGMSREPFPNDTPLALDLARVFLAVGKRFVEEANPDIRAVMKPALAGAAHTLELLLDYVASPPEPATKRQFPGDWD